MSGLLRWMCVLALACSVGACGDDSGGEGGEDLPMPITEEVSAEDGADIDTEGAAISIPGGALSEDTEVTVEVILPNDEPDADKLASLIYDFGPDGTQFEMPVELTIDFNKSVPDGMEAKMAWLDEENDVWVELDDSRVEGDSVVATTTHFTMFAIVLVVGQGQTAGGCADFEDFEACGGDVEGTWEFSLACADLEPDDILGELMCQGAAVEIMADISGTVTFESDGTYESEITNEFAFAIDLPTSCLMGATCEQFAGGDPYEESGGVCMLMMGNDPQTEMETGTYELDGNNLIMMGADDPEADEPSEYCIEGNVITVRQVSVDEETGEETVTFIQATRQ